MLDEFDYVIVGGGTAGCVTANKLSADPAINVLLLESGPEDIHPMIDIPKGFGKILGSKANTYSYQASPGEAGKTTAETWVRGHGLGGSSSVNGMIYLRGHKADYDHWENDLDLPGWGWANLGKIFYDLEDHSLGKNAWRNTGGPVHVSPSTNKSFLIEKLIAAAGQMGLPRLEDPNDPRQEGISYICSNIHKGRRWSAVRAFIDPIRARQNLHIRTNSRVRKIVFEGTRAIGVECLHDGRPQVLKARREVILCAGGLESPRLLQLSGIGDANHLSSLGITVVRNTPAVGRNMREHLIYTMQFRLTGPYSQNKEYSGWRLAKNALKYGLTKKGLFANGPYDVTGFIRADPKAERPDATFVAAPFTMDLAKWEGFEKGVPMEQQPGLSILGYVLRPESQGQLSISSADPDAKPKITHNHLTNEYDRRIAVNVARYIRNIVKQPAISPYIQAEILPGARYQTDEQLLETYSLMGGSGYHAAGTCRMGADADSVVDARLRVRGCEALRVLDLSVFPTLVSGATNIPVMAAATHGAELIIQDQRRNFYAA